MGRVARWLHQLPPAVVGVTLLAGLALVRPGDWRPGLYVMAAALLLGGLLRLFLPTLRVGVLAVRGRIFDTAVLVALGAAVLLLTSVVPAAR